MDRRQRSSEGSSQQMTLRKSAPWVASYIGGLMMLVGVVVTGIGAWDGLNGPDVPNNPNVVAAREIVERAPNPDQPIIIQPPEDELKPADLIGPGLALVGSGGAIAAASAGVGAPAAVGAGQREGQRPIEGQPRRVVLVRERHRGIGGRTQGQLRQREE